MTSGTLPGRPAPAIRISPDHAAVSVYQYGASIEPVPSLQLPRLVDVLVVGGGLGGLGAAVEFAFRDRSVAVLDPDTVAAAPSANGLGYLGPSAAQVRADEAARHQIGAAIAQARVDAVRWTERLVSELGIDCHLVTHPGAEGGPAGLDPFLLHQGMVRYALGKGVRIHERTPVVRVGRVPAKPGFEVRTNRGRIQAMEVLVTSRVGNHLRFKPLDRLTRNVSHTFLATEPVPAELLPDEPAGFVRVRSDRRLVATAAIGGPLAVAVDQLGGRLLDVHPELADLHDGAGPAITNSWELSVAGTTDGLPRVVVDDDGVYGVTEGSEGDLTSMAWMGSRAARWMCGEAEPISAAIPGPALPPVVGKLLQLVPNPFA